MGTKDQMDKTVYPARVEKQNDGSFGLFVVPLNDTYAYFSAEEHAKSAAAHLNELVHKKGDHIREALDSTLVHFDAKLL